MFDHVINEDLRKRVGLEQLYPYSIAKDLKVGDYGAGGQALISDGHIILSDRLNPDSIERVMEYYLHEVGHLVTCAAGLQQEPDGQIQHNRFFACLVAIMYRRAGILPYLAVYDFGDIATRQGPYGFGAPTDQELIERFGYIIRRSAELAPLPLSIESLARKIAREDLPQVWQKTQEITGEMARHDWAGWLYGVGVGVLSTAAVCAAFFLW